MTAAGGNDGGVDNMPSESEVLVNLSCPAPAGCAGLRGEPRLRARYEAATGGMNMACVCLPAALINRAPSLGSHRARRSLRYAQPKPRRMRHAPAIGNANAVLKYLAAASAYASPREIS